MQNATGPRFGWSSFRKNADQCECESNQSRSKKHCSCCTEQRRRELEAGLAKMLC